MRTSINQETLKISFCLPRATSLAHAHPGCMFCRQSSRLHPCLSLEGEKGQSERSIVYLQKPRKLEYMRSLLLQDIYEHYTQNGAVEELYGGGELGRNWKNCILLIIIILIIIIITSSNRNEQKREKAMATIQTGGKSNYKTSSLTN